MTEAYLAGFRKTAEEHGVNPDFLLKQAFWPLILGGAAALGLGAGTYGLYNAYKDFKTWKPTPKSVPIQKLRTDMKSVPGLGSVQDYGNALRQDSENTWNQVHE